MPLFIKSFIIFFCTFFINPVLAQENKELKNLIAETNSYYGANDLLYLGEIFEPSNSFAKGNPFFTDRYLPAKITVKNNVFENITSKYNIETDQLIVLAKTDSSKTLLITLKENWVDNFTLDNHHFVNIKNYSPNLNLKGYYELVFSGKKNLLIKYSNSFINTYSDLTPHGFYSKTKKRMYLSDHNNFILIKNKKEFLNIYAKNKNEMVSISGKVIDKNTNKPLNQILVYASIIDSSKQLHITRTKEDGSFVFSLPHLNENHEVYITAQKQKDKETSILVNRDFDTDYLLPNYIPEKINTDKISLINEMYTNHQITNLYKNEIDIKQSYMDPLPEPFNEKSNITILKDYITLPTLTEVFKEITPSTTIKNNHGIAEIHVFNSKDKTDYPQPLVLLDNIPFQDHAKLLELPPSRIYSIEVIAQPFLYGGQLLYGVVNIKSVNSNFGGLDLPTDIAMVNYITYSPKTTVSYENTIKNTVSKSHHPDFRNTLYWNPNISLTDGHKTIQFYASDYASDYEIIIRGLNNKGELIYKTKTIQISQ